VRQWLQGVLLVLLMAAQWPVHAEALLMARSRLPFAESMLVLQDAIREQGYVLSRVQRVDIGLTTFGFKTDKYRVVFFGRADQVRHLSQHHPELVPYLPLKIAIFAEAGETILVATSPERYTDMFPDPELAPVFGEWSRDLHAIFDRVRTAEE